MFVLGLLSRANRPTIQLLEEAGKRTLKWKREKYDSVLRESILKFTDFPPMYHFSDGFRDVMKIFSG